MDKIFIYGSAVSGSAFTDRVEETRRLKQNFEAGVHTILISPRRMGKTSLVNKVCESIEKPDVSTVKIDVYDCRSEYDFYNKYATEILKQTSGKIENLFENAKEFLGRVLPKISISPDMATEYSVSLGLTPKVAEPDEILKLPERIATKKNIHLVICIDEFQQIGEFKDSILFQKKLRSVWQHFQNVSFCFYGSKRHMMENLFQNKNMPFYRFGDMVFLEKIGRADWVQFVVEKFKDNGKEISTAVADKLCDIVEDYSSYVQQLAWNLYVITPDSATDELLQQAYDELLRQLSSLYENQINTLTSYQMNFIRALCEGVNTNLTSTEVLEEYNLGTKSNVARVKKALLDKELIEINGREVLIADPMFKKWFLLRRFSQK